MMNTLSSVAAAPSGTHGMDGWTMQLE